MAINSTQSPFVQWELNQDGTRKTVEVLNEQIKIVNNQAILNWKPSKYHRVTLDSITINSSSVDFVEIDLKEEIDAINKFKVNYDNGIIYFHPNLDGYTLNVARYFEEGIIRYHVSRIYFRDSNDVIHTLDEILNSITEMSNTLQLVGLKILDTYSTLSALKTAHPTGNSGDMYMVGTIDSNVIYVWSVQSERWFSIGSLRGMKGDKGDIGNSPNIKIGNVITGETGSQAKAEIIGETPNLILNLTLPKGDAGDNHATVYTGDMLNIPNTQSFDTLELDILSNTLATPTDSSKPISPDNPAILESVGDNGSFKVHVCGKNLLPNNATTQTINGITFTVNPDKSITANGTATGMIYYRPVPSANRISLSPSTYYFSGCPSGGGNDSYIIQNVVTNSEGTTLYRNDYGDGKLINVTESSKLQCEIVIWSGCTCNNLIFEPQLELGTAPTPYTPYIGQEYTVPLKDTAGNIIPFRGLETAKSRVFKDVDRLWKVRGNVGRVVFDGSIDENWIRNATTINGKYRFRIPVPDLKPNINNTTIPNILCNMLEATTPNDNYNAIEGVTVVSSASYLDIYIEATSTFDLTQFKAWLQANPLEVIYPLKEPKIITFHADAQTVLNQIEKLKDGQTVIYSTDKVAPSFEGKYWKGVKNAELFGGFPPEHYLGVNVDFATQTEAETGTNNIKVMSPLRTFQAIAKWVVNTTVDTLATTAKTIVGSINELSNKIGILNNLTTTEKSNLVGAITEVNASLNEVKIEQGIWSPILKGTTVIGNHTYINQKGTYYKIGKKVHIEGYLELTQKDVNMDGLVQIGNLPFVIAQNVSLGTMFCSATIGYLANLTNLSNIMNIALYGNGNVLDFAITNTNFGIVQIIPDNIANNFVIILSADYICQ